MTHRSVKSDSLGSHGLYVAQPGSSVRGIFQARILEWVAISFSRGSSRPRDWTPVSCIAGRFFTIWATGRVRKNKRRLSHWILHRCQEHTELGWAVSAEMEQCQGCGQTQVLSFLSTFDFSTDICRPSSGGATFNGHNKACLQYWGLSCRIIWEFPHNNWECSNSKIWFITRVNMQVWPMKPGIFEKEKKKKNLQGFSKPKSITEEANPKILTVNLQLLPFYNENFTCCHLPALQLESQILHYEYIHIFKKEKTTYIY